MAKGSIAIALLPGKEGPVSTKKEAEGSPSTDKDVLGSLCLHAKKSLNLLSIEVRISMERNPREAGNLSEIYYISSTELEVLWPVAEVFQL